MSKSSDSRQSLDLDHIRFHPASYADSHGRLFIWNERVLRGIYPSWGKFYRDFMKSALFGSLVADGILVETTHTDFILTGFDYIVEHKRVEVVSYPYEWCFQSLKDAALLILTLQERLAAEGMTLQDSHPWNIMFDGYKPLYIDLCSVMPASGGAGWIALDEFRQYVLNPLRLMSAGHGKLARALFYRDQGLSDQELAIPLVGEEKKSRGTRTRFDGLLAAAGRIFSHSNKEQALLSARPVGEIIGILRTKIEALSYPLDATEWSDYYEDFPPVDAESFPDPKRQGVKTALSLTKPKEVLDIASNRGWYSRLAVHHGCRVVAFDLDENSINKLYIDCKNDDIGIYPLVMNIISPSPGIGILNESFAPAVERFRSEMVFALALVHHLVFKSMLRFEQVAEILSAFTIRWLLVEFIPKEDIHVANWWNENYDWYSQSNFIKELMKYFSKIEIIESSPAPRVFLLCEK